MISFDGNLIKVSGARNTATLRGLIDHRLEIGAPDAFALRDSLLRETGIVAPGLHMELTPKAAKVLYGAMHGAHKLTLNRFTKNTYMKVEMYFSWEGVTVLKYRADNDTTSAYRLDTEEAPAAVLQAINLRPSMLTSEGAKNSGALVVAASEGERHQVQKILEQMASMTYGDPFSEEVKSGKWLLNTIVDSTRVIDGESARRFDNWSDQQGLLTLSVPSCQYMAAFAPGEKLTTGLMIEPTMSIGIWQTLSAWTQPYSQYPQAG